MAIFKGTFSIECSLLLLFPSGHLNICSSLAVALLNRFSDRVEIYFVVDSKWKSHLEKIDLRFKFGVFEYEREGGDKRLVEVVDRLEATLRFAIRITKISIFLLIVSLLTRSMSLIDKAKTTWELFIKDPTLIEVDQKSEQEIKKIQPDFR